VGRFKCLDYFYTKKYYISTIFLFKNRIERYFNTHIKAKINNLKIEISAKYVETKRQKTKISKIDSLKNIECGDCKNTRYFLLLDDQNLT
jgi:hypothetical protein